MSRIRVLGATAGAPDGSAVIAEGGQLIASGIHSGAITIDETPVVPNLGEVAIYVGGAFFVGVGSGTGQLWRQRATNKYPIVGAWIEGGYNFGDTISNYGVFSVAAGGIPGLSVNVGTSRITLPVGKYLLVVENCSQVFVKQVQSPFNILISLLVTGTFYGFIEQTDPTEVELGPMPYTGPNTKTGRYTFFLLS